VGRSELTGLYGVAERSLGLPPNVTARTQACRSAPGVNREASIGNPVLAVTVIS